MYEFLQITDLAAMALMVVIMLSTIRQQPSRAQTAFEIFDFFVIVYLIGIHLELARSLTAAEALSGLSIQYIGIAGSTLSSLWFCSEFCHLRLPRALYIVMGVGFALVVTGIFTAEHHHLFYRGMYIRFDDIYPLLAVRGGPFWYLNYALVIFSMLLMLILCLTHYRSSTHIQKIRIRYLLAALAILLTEFALILSGTFGNHNPIAIPMTAAMLCTMLVVVRHGYFQSFHSAVDNAFNHGNEGLIIVDEENIIIFINERISSLFPQIGLGEDINQQKEITAILRQEHAYYHAADGVDYELRVEDIKEQGRRIGFMLWFVDQTMQLETLRRLKEADETKTQFLMKVSHELRTPLNTVLGMNEMIARETDSPQIRNYTAEITTAVDNMVMQIEEILDVSRLSSKTVRLQEQPYALDEVLRKTDILIRSQAENKGLAFTVEQEKTLAGRHPVLYGDGAHVQQILVNLLSNAVKYTDQGCIRLTAGLRQENGVQLLCFAVEDTGIGIPEEDQQRIFKNFERAYNAVQSGKGGLGLGLSIVSSLTKAMHGSVTVKSTLGRGSTFTVLLPFLEVAETERKAFLAAHREAGGEAGTGAKPVPAQFYGRTVLAVDDNEKNLQVLAHLLRRTGIHLVTADGGEEAIRLCHRTSFDLIFLDHMMPAPDGIETLHRIRADAEGENHYTDVVALTANATPGAREKYLREGFADYLVKPVHPEDLEAMLEKYLEHAAADEARANAGRGRTAPGREEAAAGDGAAETESGEAAAGSGAAEGARRTREYDEDRILHRLEQHGLHVQEGLRYADGDRRLYRQLLELFVFEQTEREEKLRVLWEPLAADFRAGRTSESSQWNAFIVQVHILEGEACGLGAVSLGARFAELERAGSAADAAQIDEMYEDIMRQWRRAAVDIRSCLY
ncbi:MAG: ATP-binding protein [Anaerovoracaceae bacterium]|jgi:signal transduction histidine kinase/DNA-binding response OmpR family regulator